MRRKLLKILPLISVLLFCFAMPQKAKAEVEVKYDIQNNQVTSKVNPDGSLTIKRRIDYEFQSTANGVFYRQNLEPNQKIKHVKITTKANDAPTLNSTDFTLRKSEHGYEMIVPHVVREKHEHFTVTYAYQITNAITNYRDIAELNFMIIGNGWDTRLKKVKASVIFPGPVKDLKAWAHGPLDGKLEVDPQDGKIIMTADNLGGHTGIEVHTIFPLSVTPKNKNVKNVNHKQAVLKQEKKLAAQSNAKQKKNLMISLVLVLVSVVTGILSIFKGFTTQKIGYKPKKTSELSHDYEIPDANPVIAQILDTAKVPDSKAFTAYLMELAIHKKIKIEDYKSKLKTTYYRISLIDENVAHESTLMWMLFNEIGDGTSFTTKELKKARGKKLGRSFDDWADDQFYSADKDQYMPEELLLKKKRSNRIILGLRIASLVAAGLSLLFTRKYFWPVIIVAGLLFVIGTIGMYRDKNQINLYSKKGALEVDKVRSFKKMLNDIGRFNMKEVGDLILWEDILPYAVSFGLAKKVMKELKIEFNQDELNNSDLFFYGFLANSGKNSFAENFNTCFKNGIAAGSSSVSSGSFGSGSSGGFGGGSGGGAF